MIKKIIYIPFIFVFIFLAVTLLLPFFGIKYYVVGSDSMAPALKTNDLVYVNTGNKNIKVGSIVAVNTGDIPLLHRVIAFNNDCFTTQGDANQTPDPVWSYQNLAGVAVFHIPYIGYLFRNQYLPLIALSLYLLYLIGKRLYKELLKGKGMA